MPPLRKTTWNGWKISGSLWDQRGVKFEDYEWDVHLNIFFKELETEKELEELTSKEVWFYDRNGDSMMSSTWKGFFFERIKYVAEKLGLSDPGMKIKADEQKRQQQEQERRIAKEKEDAEVVETSYYFWKLIYGRSYDDTAVRFKITNGKVYRLYGDNPILLSGVKFSSQISVLRTKKEAREEKKSKVARKHVMEAGSGYTAIYTDRKILHDIVKKDHTSMTCACGIWFGTYDGIPYCRIEKHKKEEKVYAEEVESSFYSQ